MALLFADGFEDGLADWTPSVGTVVTTTTGARNGYSLQMSTAVQSNCVRVIPALTTVVVGAAFYTSSFSNWGSINGTMLMGLWGDAGATQHTMLYLNNAGVLTMGRATTSLGTISGAITTGTWQYVEVRATLHDTTGSITVRVNGVQVGAVTNVDTKTTGTVAAYDRLRLEAPSTATTMFDDLYICDTTGSYNNDFLGDLAVEHIRPTGDDTAQWVGSDGNSTDNYALVDEAGAAVTTDYVGSATVGNRDLYTTAPAVRTSGTVHGVYVQATAQKSDSGTRSMALIGKEGSGGSVRTGASQALTTGWLTYGQAFDRKADNSAFSISDLNAFRVGAEVTA